MIFIDGKFRDFTAPICGDQECCGECAPYLGYGFAGGFGLGGYEFCERCGLFTDFWKDEE